MANDCNYEMKIRGSKEAINRVIACLNTDYNYCEGKPEHKHFFRVFEATEEELEDNGDGTFTQSIYGYCAWSVWSCMMEGDHTYYNDVKRNHPDTFMGTSLKEQSQDCEIEVFSEEWGMLFSEHYHFKNGECVDDSSCGIELAGYTKTGKITKRINWDTYEGDMVVLNPNRENKIDGFKFSL